MMNPHLQVILDTGKPLKQRRAEASYRKVKAMFANEEMDALIRKQVEHAEEEAKSSRGGKIKKVQKVKIPQIISAKVAKGNPLNNDFCYHLGMEKPIETPPLKNVIHPKMIGPAILKIPEGGLDTIDQDLENFQNPMDDPEVRDICENAGERRRRNVIRNIVNEGDVRWPTRAEMIDDHENLRAIVYMILYEDIYIQRVLMGMTPLQMYLQVRDCARMTAKCWPKDIREAILRHKRAQTSAVLDIDELLPAGAKWKRRRKKNDLDRIKYANHDTMTSYPANESIGEDKY